MARGVPLDPAADDHFSVDPISDVETAFRSRPVAKPLLASAQSENDVLYKRSWEMTRGFQRLDEGGG